MGLFTDILNDMRINLRLANYFIRSSKTLAVTATDIYFFRIGYYKDLTPCKQFRHGLNCVKFLWNLILSYIIYSGTYTVHSLPEC